jgi:hypothetical protein
MSGEYRDELAAAHSRIAELEEKVRVLEEEARPSAGAFDGRFPELEREVTLLRQAADPARNARRRTQLSLTGAVFPFAGGILSYFHQPVFATVCSVLFLATIVWNLSLVRSLKVSTARLAAAEKKLADARRIAELEGKLADVQTRVATEARVAEAEPLDDEAAERSGDAMRRRA